MKILLLILFNFFFTQGEDSFNRLTEFTIYSNTNGHLGTLSTEFIFRSENNNSDSKIFYYECMNEKQTLFAFDSISSLKLIEKIKVIDVELLKMPNQKVLDSLSGNVDVHSSHDTYYTLQVNERKIHISDSKFLIREYDKNPQFKAIKTLIIEVNNFINKNKTGANNELN